MKGLNKFLVIILVLAVAVFCFVGCAGSEGEFTVVIIRGHDSIAYTLDNTGGEMVYLIDALEALENDSESGFSYALQGTFLTTVNGYTAVSSSNEFWAIYTDCEIEGLKYYDITWGTADYEGIMYGSATKGVSELPTNGGSTYIIKLSTY